MATHEVDQKLLAYLARSYEEKHPRLSGTLFQILGLSIMLGPRLVTARRLHEDELEAMNSANKRRLLEEIVWLTRAGLELVEEHFAPLLGERSPPVLRIFAAKLRASFYHVLSLFRNDPPITQLARSVLRIYKAQARTEDSPLAPKSGNNQRSPPRSPPSSGKSKGKARASPPRADNKENVLASSSPPDRRGVRESMLSEDSMVTNPWASLSPPPPPGLSLPDVPANLNFLLPTMDYLPVAKGSFNEASRLAIQLLPASSPLRLSVALEQCAFIWDCVHDREGSRKLARATIRDVYRTDAGLTDEEFDDATTLVGTLGRMMRRKSQEGTPRFGSATPPADPPKQFFTTQDDAPPVPAKPAPSTHPTSTAAQLSSGTVGAVAQRVVQSTSNPPHSPTFTSPRTPPQPPPKPAAASSAPQQLTTARQSPTGPARPARGSSTNTRHSPSSSGTFRVPRRPVPAQGSSVSPGRSTGSQTGSPGRSSTAPTATSTPRAATGSPQRAAKRAGSDSESPSRKQRTKREGSR